MYSERHLPHQEDGQGHEQKTTDSKFMAYCEKAVKLFCREFSTEGVERLLEFQQQHPEAKFIITASHTNNLDAPSAIKALGVNFDMLLTGESVLLEKLKYLPQRIMIQAIGRDNFFPLDYASEGKKHGVFNPENFDGLSEKMTDGKTPWIANHPFSTTGQMKKASVGPVYLAQKTGAYIVPCGLDMSGGSESMEGVKEITKGLFNRASVKFHVGEPVKLPPIDIGIIDDVFNKRKNNETVSAEEKALFSEVIRKLREQAELLGSNIAEMLPENQRGVYGKTVENRTE
ncbi:MAG: hypothetical protein COU29_01820 [Candidatus Magasanikbacteria bacterium CG10_big_fil_rev_8_21_14_0_10_36_32]|uniref:Phospholipid/glycerol acyltransferase domain-containing protein n=1 Tax=Candidatus Magasanikbacteria bacterium CG10_big_fil_rev_8_21_14_0_10_36_32 TaxID=1974646 RepID=A0A2M6W6T8_9BACT|nr:MAG: hypothetical protein COU29_01820 [Candidatus Magasanikbacteria bacterium CG10_big_fil_rev_8_21_14_0_10_36_32]